MEKRTLLDQLTEREKAILERLAAGLSDQQIAAALFLSPNTVRWYNRQIYSKLGVGSRTQAIARAREIDLLNTNNATAPSLHTVQRVPEHHLPVETTPFIGRKHEMEDIKRLLNKAHLLTLVGAPGTGKTRLAMQIAYQVADTFREGAFFVSLAPIRDPSLIMDSIARAIGVTEDQAQPLIETLKHALVDTQMLLILDNFEHLLSGAMQVSELLSATPHLKVLATSREPLHLYGEQEYAVPPLELPDPEQLDPRALADCESIALFMQRARAVRSDFELTQENALDVAQICLRLDGMPLAIELAAARSKLFSPRTLLTRLTSTLDTLTGGSLDLPARQQTLRNTIEWSYNLMDEAEKILFARLAVFRGGWSPDTFDAVCGQDVTINVLDGLEILLNKSLIQQKELLGEEPRFVMLETVREYASERLEASGEAELIRNRHAECFVELAERAEPELRLAQHMYWFRLLETEHENLRAALKWAFDQGDRILGARLVGALYLFWFAYGHHREGQQWTQKLVDQQEGVPPIYQPKLLLAAGHMSTLYDLEAAKRYFAQAIHVGRELGDRVHIAWSLAFLGYAMMYESDAALTIAEEGLTLFRELKHKPGIAQALNIIGNLALFRADYDRAKRAYEECLAVSQETGETRRVRFLISNLSVLAQQERDYERARRLAEQGLRLALELNIKADIADALAGFAGILGVTGQPQQAARLLGAWEAALERMGATPQAATKPKNERNIAAIRAQLGDIIFGEAWAQGRGMTLLQAVEHALA